MPVPLQYFAKLCRWLALIGPVIADFHIFISDCGSTVTVRQAGLFGCRVFSSLWEATGHLRELAKGHEAFVVIYDGVRVANRIPLHVSSAHHGGSRGE